MKFFRVLWGYIKWHYTRAVISLTVIWKNLLFFLFHFFSIRELIGEFFTPWKRNADSYKKGFNPKAFFEVFIVNIIMRIFGVIARSIIILVGCIACAIFVILYPIAIIFWFFLPILVIYLFILGLVLIFA